MQTLDGKELKEGDKVFGLHSDRRNLRSSKGATETIPKITSPRKQQSRPDLVDRNGAPMQFMTEYLESWGLPNRRESQTGPS